jgi:hypothetical protein
LLKNKLRKISGRLDLQAEYNGAFLVWVRAKPEEAPEF